MKIENHVLEILQLYEYAMAIGKSLDYEKNCDLFLKLILKRKSFNAAWIIESDDNVFRSTYAIPLGKEIKIKTNGMIKNLLGEIDKTKILDVASIDSTLAPMKLDGGKVAIFNLNEQGFLFLYSKKDNITSKNISQLEPVIDKFGMHLKACKAFKEQEQLLHNLEVQNQELSDYAHMVSHDLKSPLRNIDYLTTSVTEDYNERLDDRGKQSLGLIRNNVEKMDTLINGILEYSTIGKNKIDVYDVDLSKLVESIIESLKIPEHFSVNINQLPTIKGDKYRLQQLFQNLISNAISYNDKTNGLIEIGAEEKDNAWQFYVKDNGMGIEKQYFDKIFNTFEKLETTVNSTGIGLSIVKKIVDLYGGKIWLTSELNKGTTFYFTLKKDSHGTA